MSIIADTKIFIHPEGLNSRSIRAEVFFQPRVNFRTQQFVYHRACKGKMTKKPFCFRTVRSGSSVCRVKTITETAGAWCLFRILLSLMIWSYLQSYLSTLVTHLNFTKVWVTGGSSCHCGLPTHRMGCFSPLNDVRWPFNASLYQFASFFPRLPLCISNAMFQD